MQGATGQTVEEIRKISEIISNIEDFVASITTAVKEQGAVMSELVANISQAGEGIG